MEKYEWNYGISNKAFNESQLNISKLASQCADMMIEPLQYTRRGKSTKHRYILLLLHPDEYRRQLRKAQEEEQTIDEPKSDYRMLLNLIKGDFYLINSPYWSLAIVKDNLKMRR